MEVNELLNLGKSKILTNKKKELGTLFRGFFMEVFGREPKMCCSFSDFNLLRSYYLKPNEKTMVTKYKVLFSRDMILSYLKSGKVYRTRASHASDDFLEKFLKHANKKVYPNVDKMVVLIEAKPPRMKKPMMVATAPVITKPKKTRQKKVRGSKKVSSKKSENE